MEDEQVEIYPGLFVDPLELKHMFEDTDRYTIRQVFWGPDRFGHLLMELRGHKLNPNITCAPFPRSSEIWKTTVPEEQKDLWESYWASRGVEVFHSHAAYRDAMWSRPEERA